MSRIRTVKPDFWSSEQIILCSPTARLLFIGLWNFCDDNGVHVSSYIRAKAEVYPGDACSADDIKKWVGELINIGLLREYVAEDNEKYWIVTGWHKHQKIDRPNPRYPLPQGKFKHLDKIAENDLRTISDNSTNDDRSLVDASPPEGKGKEGKGKELLSFVIEIFDYWKSMLSHPKAKLDKKREASINRAIGLGFSSDEIKRAIDGCRHSEFHQGKNPDNRKHDGLNLILRDSEQIEKFIAIAELKVKQYDAPDITGVL